MVVYTAARLQNLDQDDAAKVAQFIRVSTTEGQRPGSGNGELPGGFLPISKTGVTAPLYASAQEVADAVEAQKKPAAKPTADPTASARRGDADGGGGAGDPARTPLRRGGDAVRGARARRRRRRPPPAAAPMPATQAVGSDLAGGLLPLLILLGAIGCVATARDPGRHAVRPGTSMTATMDRPRPSRAPQPTAPPGTQKPPARRPAAARPRAAPRQARRAPPRAPSRCCRRPFTMIAIVCLWVAASCCSCRRSRRTGPRTCSTTSSAATLAGADGAGRPDRAGR